MHNHQLNEGLRPGDLSNLIEPMFEIDRHRSKMGEDRDICVLSFSVKDRLPAKDIMEFIERGYSFVLDADVSSGEDLDGGYTVFVELERKKQLHDQIREIVEGLKRLSDANSWGFRYHKEFITHKIEEQTLESFVPNTPLEYDGLMTKIKTESIKKFFSKTLMDDLTINQDIITIHKPFNQQLKFKLIPDSTAKSILENSSLNIQVDTASMGEVFWLTKVLGDYNIIKVGQQFLLKNKNESLVLERLL